MATLYPTALDDSSTLPDDKQDSTITAIDHKTHHNNLADAVRAIETVLGVSPAGSYASVAAALLDKVSLGPTSSQTIQGTGDIVGLAIKAAIAQNLQNVFEMRLSNNALGVYIDKTGALSAQALKIAGAALASTHLADAATLAYLASPAFTGTPTAPTPTGGDNSTKLATTAFVQSALAAFSTAAGTSGTLASRPAATTQSGKFYYATDQDVLYFSNGTTWVRQGVPAGTVVDWMQPTANVPTGWVAYDGSVLPGSTGIYADLAAHLGTTTLPDTRGRMTVAKGTHSDVASIGNSDGLTVGSRRPKHKHTVGNPTINISDPGHAHTTLSGTAAGTGTTPAMIPYDGNLATNPTGGLTNNATTGIGATASGGTVGPQTGSEPTDSVAYITTLKIAKL